jgi:antitoxin PrlF
MDCMQHFVQAPKKVKKSQERGIPAKQPEPALASFRGRKTATGNSLALRFDRALFKSHPEFSGDVDAYVIAPGRMLVVAEMKAPGSKHEDPVIASFLSFLAQDMERNPNRIQPLDASLMARIEKLTVGVTTRSDEPLGNEALL